MVNSRSAGPLGEARFVEPDLETDQAQALGERVNLGGHALLVLAQQAEPVFFIA
jgi:hypothetical protein